MSFWSRIKREVRTRRPWIAGALNFTAWGLGYLFAGRKKLLGLSLFAFLGGNYLVGIAYAAGRVSLTQMSAAGLFLWLFLGFTLARDAYFEAKKGSWEAENG